MLSPTLADRVSPSVICHEALLRRSDKKHRNTVSVASEPGASDTLADVSLRRMR